MNLASLSSRVSVTAPLGLPEVAGDPLNVGIVWDAENQLTRVSQGPTELARFVYDGLGRRQQKIAGGVTRTYISDGSSLIEERVSTGQTLRYVEGLGIDQHLAMQDGATATYYVADYLGSVAQATNASGVVTQPRKYDPWGNLLAGASAAGWSFTGREWDPETGLAFYRARYYDPKMGRFISEDPIGLDGGINLFAYVLNNPANATDPSGEILYKCSRASNGAMFFANHVYFCNPATHQSCGKGKRGGKPRPRVEPAENCTLPPPPGIVCVPIPGTEGREQEILDCCRYKQVDEPGNNGFVPFKDDCFTYVARCLAKAGVEDVPTPGGRVGCRTCTPSGTKESCGHCSTQ